MIFKIFKSKPKLSELIPEGFVDIHSHILPSIDDGAKNINESIKLIDAMKKLGFSKLIATPHIYPGLYDNNVNTIKNSYDDITSVIKSKIEIDYGAEYFLDASIIEDDKINNLITIKDKFILIEFNFISLYPGVFEILFELQTIGYNIIIAHPERYLYLSKDNKKLNKLKQIGCQFQINLLSITGYYGKEVLDFSKKLIKNNMINFCGSDIHNLSHIKYFDKKVKINVDEISKIKAALENNLFFK
tara:strand:+ start:181 stop:915 length:735 start_codon:yes stop_codon:yes gene_type:complete